MANHGQLLEYSLDPVPDQSKLMVMMEITAIFATMMILMTMVLTMMMMMEMAMMMTMMIARSILTSSIPVKSSSHNVC